MTVITRWSATVISQPACFRGKF